MRDCIALICAIAFIENNLEDRIAVHDVAAAAYLSSSHLQSLFAHTFHTSIGGYILKRRLCLAAKRLIDTDASVTDIAFDLGYANAESFTRAFKKQFLMAPSSYRKQHGFSELYPRLMINEKEGFSMIEKYDLTAIGETILASKGTYIICADVDHLMAINEQLSRAAGDAAIAETALRIGKSIRDDMAYFRIGADHFIILTGRDELSAAEGIAKSIISYADTEVSWGGGIFKFSISMGIVKIPSDIQNAKETIDASEQAMLAAKRDRRNSYCII